MTDYDLIIKQMEALADDSSDHIPIMANVSSLLFYAMEDINWAGFYLVKEDAKNDALILGPFQGKVACVRIEKGKGVCGTAWAENRVQLVPDVHAFPGHIACDSVSRSEIVVPLHRGGEVFAVLDIDSPIPARFKEEDKDGLVKLAEALEGIIK
ncbi:MAG: GAF domain-containing protein [Firmicutes bacterium]|nr:GAF domain-containing protein [Bacillota bacterium]